MNYRSVVLTGRIRELDERAEKRAAMARLVDRLSAGRDATLRPMHEWELDVTRVLAVGIDHASAKIRSGGPLESIDDVTHPAWAGVVPLRLVASAPLPDEHVREASAPAIAACFSPTSTRASDTSSV
jgi:hypothetical protein